MDNVLVGESEISWKREDCNNTSQKPSPSWPSPLFFLFAPLPPLSLPANPPFSDTLSRTKPPTYWFAETPIAILSHKTPTTQTHFLTHPSLFFSDPHTHPPILSLSLSQPPIYISLCVFRKLFLSFSLFPLNSCPCNVITSTQSHCSLLFYHL